jgi:phenylalanine ammonia-lyase
MQDEFLKALDNIIAEEISSSFASSLSETQISAVVAPAMAASHTSFAQTSNMDAEGRLTEMMGCVSRTVTDVLILSATTDGVVPLAALGSFQANAARRGSALLQDVRRAYLNGERGPAPASRYLQGTRPVYDFVRNTLGIRMHGKENFDEFELGLGVEDVTIGESVSMIYEVCSRIFLLVPDVLTCSRSGYPGRPHAGRYCEDVYMSRWVMFV